MATRREFLVGLLSTGAIAAIPTAVLEAVADNRWQEAFLEVYSKYMTELILYGSAAIASSPDFPFVRLVPHEEWLNIPELYRSSGDY